MSTTQVQVNYAPGVQYQGPRRLKAEAWCWFIILLFFFWPLCWLPFVMDQCYEGGR